MKQKVLFLVLMMGLSLMGNLTGCSSSVSNNSSNLSIVQERENYDEVDLKTEIPANAVLMGEDPETIALNVFALDEGETQEGGAIQQTVIVNNDNPNQPIVIITQTGLADDSVRGIRYRVDFEKKQTSEQSQWQMVWVGRQYTCQPGRGSQEWTTDLCS